MARVVPKSAAGPAPATWWLAVRALGAGGRGRPAEVADRTYSLPHPPRRALVGITPSCAGPRRRLQHSRRPGGRKPCRRASRCRGSGPTQVGSRSSAEANRPCRARVRNLILASGGHHAESSSSSPETGLNGFCDRPALPRLPAGTTGPSIMCVGQRRWPHGDASRRARAPGPGGAIGAQPGDDGTENPGQETGTALAPAEEGGRDGRRRCPRARA